MSKKKTNPHRKPATQADVEKARQEGREEGIRITWSIYFTVMRDKEGYELDDLRRVWGEIEDLSDSIAKGYCTPADLRQILKLEAGAQID